MQIRSENYPRYYRRFLIMGICAIGFALYCLYDGFVGYPARRTAGFERFKTEATKIFADEHYKTMALANFEVVAKPEFREEWDHYAHDSGIPSGPDVVVQFIMATVCGVVGLLLVSIPLRARGRWIEVSDTGITSSWGESFQFDEVEVVNKRKWRDKGICKVTHVSSGRRRTFVIDDFKFDRYATDAILYELEQRIDSGRIVNGPPEPAPEGKVAEIVGAGKVNQAVAT